MDLFLLVNRSLKKIFRAVIRTVFSTMSQIARSCYFSQNISNYKLLKIIENAHGYLRPPLCDSLLSYPGSLSIFYDDTGFG